MIIKSVEYVQKSRPFLYPALGIKRGGSVTPIQTYMQWKGHYKIADRKLICLYYLRNDIEFTSFEKTKLIANTMFENFYQTDDEKGIYVFDFDIYKDSWDKVVKGKYSKLCDDYKNMILNFYAGQNTVKEIVDSYLNPGRYYKDYAEFYRVDLSLLESVEELCSIPNFEKEELDVESVDIKITI